MKIAIAGAGISGLTAAAELYPQHDITVFEANRYTGGHTNTIDVHHEGDRQQVDTGFIVFNRETYPNFISLLERLKVKSQPAPMSFSVRCDKSGLEYRGAGLNGLFAQRTNLWNPRFYRLLRGLLRFNRRGRELLDCAEDVTVGEYFDREQYPREFVEQYFLPMGAAVWSCPPQRLLEFPVAFIARFYHNHGLLNVAKRPQWRVICGGSKSYVEQLIKPFAGRIRLQTPVQAIHRDSAGVVIRSPRGDERFDHVVLACHSDQALRMLAQPSAAEREVLGAFPYQKNLAVLHTDTSVLPQSRRAWACWNYRIGPRDSEAATVTYNMNLLQGFKSPHVYCVTLNPQHEINPARVIREIQYAHPLFAAGRDKAQQRWSEINGQQHTSFCGAYWRNGFQEDGVVSGLKVAAALQAGAGAGASGAMVPEAAS